ncbi:MAG: hypothetical protein ACLFM7_05245 [Bacteroidales bacterium]
MNHKDPSSKFPAIEAETLSGEKITFPDVTKGKYAFILIAFKRQTQGEVDSWLDPFIKEFGKRKSVTFYEIPMISKNWKWMSGWIDAGMRAGVPKAKHDHVATYYGPLSKYFSHFNVEDTGTVYVFLLDKNGNIIYKTSGPADDYKFSELRRILNERIGA